MPMRDMGRSPPPRTPLPDPTPLPPHRRCLCRPLIRWLPRRSRRFLRLRASLKSTRCLCRPRRRATRLPLNGLLKLGCLVSLSRTETILMLMRCLLRRPMPCARCRCWPHLILRWLRVVLALWLQRMCATLSCSKQRAPGCTGCGRCVVGQHVAVGISGSYGSIS